MAHTPNSNSNSNNSGVEKDQARKDVSATPEAADFETAIEKTGFGRFNLFMLLVAFPSTCANMFETTTMAYILPVAECDLRLTFVNKGLLNAMTYAGMITSAVVWGYLADTLGRKKILVYGYLADAVCVLGSSLSQNFEMLLVFKFLGGLMVCGPGAVLFSYLSELHGAKHRPIVMLVLGIIGSLAQVLLPLLAWAIFPRDWDTVLFGSFNVHTWQIFLLVCALPALLTGILISFMPESPKFLMSQGRNAEALRAFQKMYAFNTRQPYEAYPIKLLVEEVPSRDSNANDMELAYTIESGPVPKKSTRQSRSFTEALRDGMQQIKPLFKRPLLGHSLHVYTMQWCILLGLNTIRLWLPQLFASIAEYEALETTVAGSSNLCNILEYSMNKTTTTVTSTEYLNCDSSREVSVSMYMDNIIVALAGFVGYFVASGVVKILGQERLLTCGLFISGLLGLSLYWSSSGLSTLIISSAFITVASVSTASLLGLVMSVFPTSLRSLIVSFAMMFGRLGALSGNVLFPLLVGIGCIPPFIMVGLSLICASAMSIILPSPKKIAFK